MAGASTRRRAHGRVRPVLEAKLDQLKTLIRSFESCVVAYSGGVDSVLLAVVSHEVLGQSALAAIADSPSLPRSELQEARAIAEEFGFPLEVIQTQEFENDEYVLNPDRVDLGPRLKALGFVHVTVDLLGYRRGSLNESVPEPVKQSVVVSQ